MLTDSRLYPLNDAPIRPERAYVLYWMTSARRLEFNFALEAAVAHAAALRRPLVILEALRCGYQHASDRLHTFVLQGMAEHRGALQRSRAVYYPYVEPAAGAGSGLIAALSRQSCVVVTDWYPAFFLPRMHAAAARQIDIRLEAIDTNGLLPVAEAGRAIPMAHGFRAHLQRTLRAHLRAWPVEKPFAALPRGMRATIDPATLSQWPAADAASFADAAIRALPIDHGVPAGGIAGGTRPARARLATFIAGGLARYGDHHNQPEQDATSRLSPWLHFGHLSVHEVFQAVMTHEKWTSRKLGSAARGAREGWWNVSASAQSFLDELVTWRELAFNTAAFVPGYGDYATLPAWARHTLDAHRDDRREHHYTLEQFDAAATHDPLWNAAQRQLKQDGWFHGYMRMLWGKKILEWSAAPEDALGVMEHLMNRYSLDGRDPVSYASYAWVLGMYDRPWPERAIFGTVRTMTSASARRKLRLKNYLATYGPSC